MKNKRLGSDQHQTCQSKCFAVSRVPDAPALEPKEWLSGYNVALIINDFVLLTIIEWTIGSCLLLQTWSVLVIPVLFHSPEPTLNVLLNNCQCLNSDQSLLLYPQLFFPSNWCINKSCWFVKNYRCAKNECKDSLKVRAALRLYILFIMWDHEVSKNSGTLKFLPQSSAVFCCLKNVLSSHLLQRIKFLVPTLPNSLYMLYTLYVYFAELFKNNVGEKMLKNKKWNFEALMCVLHKGQKK